MSSALQSDRHHSLVFWTCSGFVMRKDLRMRGHESAQSLVVFVVDKAYLAAAEKTSFFNWLLHCVLGSR
jgi:hypothetical protein